MKRRTFALSVGTVALGALLTVSPSFFAAESSGTTAKDVSRKAGETGRAIKDYTVEQRDEAIKKAKTALDDLDARIRRMERKLDGEWERMDQGAARKPGRRWIPCAESATRLPNGTADSSTAPRNHGSRSRPAS